MSRLRLSRKGCVRTPGALFSDTQLEDVVLSASHRDGVVGSHPAATIGWRLPAAAQAAVRPEGATAMPCDRVVGGPSPRCR